MIKIECLKTENIKGLNNTGFSYEFNCNSVSYVYDTSTKKLNDLFRACCLFKKYSDENIFIDETKVSNYSVFKRINIFNKLVCVIDTYANYEENKSVYANLKIAYSLKGFANKEIEKAIANQLAFFEIENIKNLKICELDHRQLMLYLFARDFDVDKNNVIIKIDDNLLLNTGLFDFFKSLVAKINSGKKEIIIFTTYQKILEEKDNIINLSNCNETEYKIEKIYSFTTNKHYAKTRFFIRRYLDGIKTTLVKDWWKMLLVLIVSMVMLSFLLIGSLYIKNSLTSNAKFNMLSIIYIVLILVGSVLWIIFKVWIDFIYTKKIKQDLMVYNHFGLSKQILIFYCPFVSLVISIITLLITLLTYHVTTQLILNWPISWNLFKGASVCYFLVVTSESFIVSMYQAQKIY